MLRLIFILLLFSNLTQAQDTSKVVFTPVLNQNLEEDYSYIYCASSALMWKSFADYLGEKPNSNSALVKKLNKELKYEPALEKKYWVSGTGRHADRIVDSVNLQMQEKFDKLWSPNFSSANNPLLSYAHLEKNVAFKRPLTDHFYQLPFKDNVQVDYFGIEAGDPKSRNKNVLLHDFENEDNFIMEFLTKDSLDEIYLAKIPFNSNLLDQYNSIIRRVKFGVKEELKGSDILHIPFLNMEEIVHYHELENLHFTNEKISSGITSSIQQSVKFELNEKGMKLISSVDLMMEFGLYDMPIPRQLYFDQPFLVVMKRRNSDKPYFLYWVSGSEFMRFDKPDNKLDKRVLGSHEKVLLGGWKSTGNSDLNGEVSENKYFPRVGLQFFVDGTYSITRNDGDTKFGSWELSHDGQLKLTSKSTSVEKAKPLIWNLSQITTDRFVLGKKDGYIFEKQ